METYEVLPTKDGSSISSALTEVAESSDARLILTALKIPKYQHSVRDLAKDLNLSLDVLFTALEVLKSAGLVKEDGSKWTPVEGANVDQVINFKSFKTAALDVLLRQTDDGPCKFGSLTVCTNQEVLNKFIKAQDDLLNKFIEESVNAKDTDLVVGHIYAMADMISTGGSK